ncbi:Tad domain-containing protein [Candidatus Villigracilis saccharophilus]|uniref:Tad domain-containing protein n=1 Tax=Candidatus Villigracilis saccharophilus TaxID=3140684 RepID=UPI0031F188A9
MTKHNKTSKTERGQALIIITFAIIGLIGLVGLAVDGGMAYSDHRHAQNAADSAAYAAALAHVSDPTHSTDITLAAKNIALNNGYDSDLVSNTVTITTTPSASGCPAATGPGVENLDIRVEIESHINTTFATVVGIRQMTNRVFATARACDMSGGGPFYAGSSVFATKLGNCGNGQKDKALFIQGSSKLQVWGGDLGTASLDGNCIDFTGGEAQLKKAESGTECADVITAAPSSESSDADWSSLKGQDGCGKKIFNQTIAAPPADLGITCSSTAEPVSLGSSTLKPGNWTGDFPPSGISTLNPGVYCVTGDFKVNNNAKLTGNGVTIVLKTGELKWNGGAEVKLSAPTSGDTKGLLIYMPPGNSSDLDVNGNSNAKITGTILAQDSNCYFAGSGQLQKQTLQFICYTWGMNGNGQAEIMYDSSLFYGPLNDPAIILIQ